MPIIRQQFCGWGDDKLIQLLYSPSSDLPLVNGISSSEDPIASGICWPWKEKVCGSLVVSLDQTQIILFYGGLST